MLIRENEGIDNEMIVEPLYIEMSKWIIQLKPIHNHMNHLVNG